MECLGAIVFLDRDEHGSALFFQDILFDPAALWLSETLRRSGVERFLVVCDAAQREAAAACFPDGTCFVTSQATDAPARLAEFLSLVPGPVAVVTRPVLLAPEGTHFSLPSKDTTAKSVYTLRGSALAAALKDGKNFDEALSALGELTGRTVREDVTSRIFERFCVGK